MTDKQVDFQDAIAKQQDLAEALILSMQSHSLDNDLSEIDIVLSPQYHYLDLNSTSANETCSTCYTCSTCPTCKTCGTCSTSTTVDAFPTVMQELSLKSNVVFEMRASMRNRSVRGHGM